MQSLEQYMMHSSLLELAANVFTIGMKSTLKYTLFQG